MNEKVKKVIMIVKLNWNVIQSLLKGEAEKTVKELLPDYANGDLSSLCVWPDQIRHWYKYKWSSPLHFIDTPDNACSFDYSSNSIYILSFLSFNSLISIWFLYTQFNSMFPQEIAMILTASRTCASPVPSRISLLSFSITDTAPLIVDVTV